MSTHKRKPVMNANFLDGSPVDPIYQTQIARLIHQSSLATHYFSEDELEEYAASLEGFDPHGENK